MPGELIIGLMSGTSVDGIDAVLVEFESSTQLQVVASQFFAFDKSLQQGINRLAQHKGLPSEDDYGRLHIELANLYANAALDLLSANGIEKSAVQAISNHGQTIAHEPPISIQIGDAQSIANLTGIPTISQFRQADLALGGQGAPLMPAFHQAVFGEPGGTTEDTLILNLGGIANLSLLGNSVIGFDTGPANTLLDQWIDHCRQTSFDKGGRWAESGDVIPEVLDILLADPYFSLPYPKSTGPDHFNLAWLSERVAQQLALFPAVNVQATLLELTVVTIAMGLAQMKSVKGTIYACGGGVLNKTLMNRLAISLDGFSIKLTDELGVPANWVEATGFAWLGYCHLHGIPSNLPSVTGASRQAVLGQQSIPIG